MKMQEQRLSYFHLSTNQIFSTYENYPTHVNERQLAQILDELNINSYQLLENDSPIQYLYEQFKMEGGYSTKKL